MKKSLVALAAMSVIGAASAQSTVTLYGLADAYVGSERIGTFGVSNGDTKTVVNSGGLNGSRWGLRVSEDLGGGLAAIAQVESGFDISTGGQQQGALFGRQAFVGLKGGFGTVTLGRQYGAYDDMKGALSLQGNSSFDATGGTPGVSGIGAWTGYSPRINNAIRYSTNNYSGFSGTVTYGLGEDKAGNRDASSSLSIGAVYSNGPIFVTLVHQNEATGPRSATNGKNELQNTLIGGSYDLGVVKLGGGYNEARARVNGTNSDKAKEFFLGLSAPLGATTLKAQYARSKVSGQAADNSIGLEALYDFSKRTTAYVGYNITEYKDAGPTGGDLKNRRFGVGLRHKF